MSELLNELSGKPAEGGTGETDPAHSAMPAWMETISTEARTDDFVNRLGRYQTSEALGKALIETQDFARGRVALPKDGDEMSRREFYAKVRPESADAYTLHLPDGMESSPLVDAFRPFAHDIGLSTHQAEELTKFINQRAMDEVSQTSQTGANEVMAYQLEVGEAGFAQRRDAIINMIAMSGIEGDDFLPALQKTMGAGKAIRFLSWVAEKTGELHKVDGAQVNLSMGSLSVAEAAEKLDSLGRDAEFMSKARVKNSREWQLREDLMARQARG